jgi:hypothetical protein
VWTSFAFAISSARAGEPPGARWPDEAFPIPYAVAKDLGGLDDENALAAISRAFESWQAIDCLPVLFEPAGRVTQTDFGAAPDGVNGMFVLGSHWPKDPKLRSDHRIAIADGLITEADIGLNSDDFQYAVDGDGKSALDVEGAMAHEIGHLLGLQDSDINGATMNPAMVGLPEARSLDASDIASVCDLYFEPPDSGLPDTGTASAQGDSCERTDDCTEDFLCVVDNGDSYCASRCATTADCAAGTSCVDPGSGSPVCILDRDDSGCAVVHARTGWLGVLLALGAATRRRSR